MKDQATATGRDTKIPAKLRNATLSPDGKWQSFPAVNHLLRYVNTGIFFARVKVNGKVIRQSLETDVFTTAITNLPDFLKKHRAKRRIEGAPQTFADAQKLYEQDLDNDHTLSENSKRYRRYCIKKLNDTWADLGPTRLSRVSKTACREWAGRIGKLVEAGELDEQYFNNVLGTLRGILKRGGIFGPDDPTEGLERLSVEIPDVKLPTLEQFQKILHEMETSGAGQQQACADFARFLAFSGCRLSEARRVTWADVDMQAGHIVVHSAKVRRAGGVKEPTRKVPIVPPMRELLTRLAEQPHEAADRVCAVGECEKSLRRACEKVGVQKLTHHRLRDFFATIAIESGVDIPTVAVDWLGHSKKDGGALLLRRYRKSREEHSRNMASKVTFCIPTTDTAAAR